MSILVIGEQLQLLRGEAHVEGARFGGDTGSRALWTCLRAIWRREIHKHVNHMDQYELMDRVMQQTVPMTVKSIQLWATGLLYGV